MKLIKLKILKLTIRKNHTNLNQEIQVEVIGSRSIEDEV